jgi:hypothetical protein
MSHAGHTIPGKYATFCAVAVLVAVVCACSVYANLTFLVTHPDDYRYFPPFEPGVNANKKHHLGAEYFSIASSLVEGEGFAHPFRTLTGPTAWMPPLLPAIQAGMLQVCDGRRNDVVVLAIVLQDLTWIVTGLLVLALARQTGSRVSTGMTLGIFLAGLVGSFKLAFQYTTDCWLVMLALGGLLVGLCWARPLGSRAAALAWGVFGGLSALVSPVVGLVWGVLSLASGARARSWDRLGIAVLAAGLTISPWVVRNYQVFGRLIPVKSNLAFELYQSQCLLPDGVSQTILSRTHPFTPGTAEREEYLALGEMAFLDHKWEQFRDAVRANPWDFAERMGQRFLAVTVVYFPWDRAGEHRRPWTLWMNRLTHPLPFLALLVLLLTARRMGLHPAQKAVIAVYLVYLLPYVVASYAERYGFALLGLKVLLVLWGAERLLLLVSRARTRADSAAALAEHPHRSFTPATAET